MLLAKMSQFYNLRLVQIHLNFNLARQVLMTMETGLSLQETHMVKCHNSSHLQHRCYPSLRPGIALQSPTLEKHHLDYFYLFLNSCAF